MRKLNNMEDFTRDIQYRALLLEDSSISLTGTMRDCFHDIEMNILVDVESLTITDAKVTFRKAPSQYCDRAEGRLDILKGVVIGKGLSRNINLALGGEEGCGNLRTILVGLLPLAMNVKAGAGFDDEEEMLDTIHHHLQGTCVGYPVAEE